MNAPRRYVAGAGNSHLEEVFLDGRRLALCGEAREGIAGETGWASVYATDPAGRFERDCFGRVKTTMLHGRVEIRAVN